jgi:hypothetical protein
LKTSSNLGRKILTPNAKVKTVVDFSDVVHDKAAVGLGKEVSYRRRDEKSTESGILGMNMASTIKGWPGKKAAYEPLWLQILEKIPALPKEFSICLKREGGGYSGKMEVGGQLNDPTKGGVAPTGEEIKIELIPAQNDWAMETQLFSRPGGGGPKDDTPLKGPKGPITIILDTGAQ